MAVLRFHKVGSPPPEQSSTWFCISESVFEGYLRWLQSSNWRVIDVQTFLRGLDFSNGLPERAALLTL
jgi:hypothetical protein